MIARLLLVAVLLGVVGCATQQKMSQSFDTAVRDAHLRTLVAIDTWKIKGRLSVRTDQGGHIGRLLWTRKGSIHQIDIYGSLGAGHVRIAARPGLAELTDSKGHSLSRPTMQAALEAYVGWYFPGAELASWIVGAVAPGSVARQEWDTLGRLGLIEQAGWQVRLSKYDSIDPYELPTRIDLVAGDQWQQEMTARQPAGDRPVHIKLVINSWGIH